MATISTLIQGSQLLNVFSTITFVKVLFVKGFSIGGTLHAEYIPATTSIRFWIEEISGDNNMGLYAQVNQESFFVKPTGAVDTSFNAYMLPIYTMSGAVIILKIDVTHADYISFVANTVVTTRSETLSFIQLTTQVASSYNGSVNRESGLTMFDDSYVSAFNKRVTLPVNITGIVPFITSGFDVGDMWIWQTKDIATGDIYLAVAANSVSGNDSDFGTPVLIATNTGTLLSPTYIYPTNPYTAVPTTRYQFSAISYLAQSTVTSPYPYFIAMSADNLSALVFTTVTSGINTSFTGKGKVSYDTGAHYLGLFKSGSGNLTGLGGAISTSMLKSSLVAVPLTHLTGIRVISTGGISSTDIKLKQRSATTTNQVVLLGTYPMFDLNNRVFLSLSENNPSNSPTLYGAEVDVSESGTYVIHSQLGSTVTVVTNRLLYNAYYNGIEQVQFNVVESDLFPSITPAQVINGNTDYRCFYIKNRHPNQTFDKVTIWSDLNCNNLLATSDNSQYVQFAVYPSITRTGNGTDNVAILGGGVHITGNGKVIQVGTGLLGNKPIGSSTSGAELYGSKHNLLGFVPSTSDYIYTPISTPILASVDLRADAGPVEDQGTLNACTANSTVSACELILQANTQFVHLSRRFNYYESREADGLLGADGGAYLRTAIDAAYQVGLPTEATWPYTIAEYNVVPSSDAMTEAATRKITRYEIINDNISGLVTGDLYKITSALCEGYPVVIGFSLTDAFYNISGDFVYQSQHPYRGSTQGAAILPLGHAVVIVGYINDYNAFIIENSWGSGWGYNGYALLPYAVISDIQEAWVIKGFQGMVVPPFYVAPSTTPPAGVNAPSGVTFDFVSAESSGIVINNLAPGECVPIWVKRVVNANSTVTKQDVLSYLRIKAMY